MIYGRPRAGHLDHRESRGGHRYRRIGEAGDQVLERGVVSDQDNGCEVVGQLPNDIEQPMLGFGVHAVIDPRRGPDSELCRDEVPGAPGALGR
jgi:hypothetical protein